MIRVGQVWNKIPGPEAAQAGNGGFGVGRGESPQALTAESQAMVPADNSHQ